ncbi:hypothetical protein [Methanococcus voltae]|uniref:Uncharacterized protein n=1 Tax=Methanococcus voltae (strain ATCC BAA-1334 / A3) TaxID=456320 RepID=D7DSG2_METV3|nr:hypothetical protein [Methanococcus voltae]MCS3901598.1 hypothetical protein [Methanococcus voltae]
MALFNSKTYLKDLESTKSKDLSEKALKKFKEDVFPCVDYPDDILQRERKISLIKILDDLFGNHTVDGELNYLTLLDAIHDLLCKNQLNELEYTYMVQILSFYIYHTVLFNKTLDLQVIADIICKS